MAMSFAAVKKERCNAAGAVASFFAKVTLAMEIYAHVVVIVTAWFSTAYLLPIYLLIHLAMTVVILGEPMSRMFWSPLLWLVPVGGSHIFEQEKPRRVTAFRLCSWVLKALVAVLQEYGKGMVRCHRSHVCETLPPWLRQPWWDPGQDTCYVQPEYYHQCLKNGQWYRNGYCNFRAGHCQLDAAVPSWLRTVIFSAVFGSNIAVLLQPLAAAIWSCASCCFKTQSKPEPMNANHDETIEPKSVEASFTNQALLLILTIGPTVLDVFLDVNGIVQFVLTGNFMFAVASAFIFAFSLYQQMQRGAIKNFYKACAESLSQAAATDELEMILLSEKTVEAPLQFLIQIYSVLFVTSSEFAVGSFCFSLALSLYGMAGAAFDLIELDLWPVFRERDYAILS